jgi:hypothetical protein
VDAVRADVGEVRPGVGDEARTALQPPHGDLFGREAAQSPHTSRVVFG